MLYFDQDVCKLKAWEFYLGNSFWTLFVGLILLLIAKVLGLIGIESDAIDNLLHRTGQFTHAQDPHQIAALGNAVTFQERSHLHNS